MKIFNMVFAVMLTLMLSGCAPASDSLKDVVGEDVFSKVKISNFATNNSRDYAIFWRIDFEPGTLDPFLATLMQRNDSDETLYRKGAMEEYLNEKIPNGKFFYKDEGKFGNHHTTVRLTSPTRAYVYVYKCP